MSRVLVLATHPDDEVLGCGGVIARYAAAGDDVHVLVMTRGVEELFTPERVARTREELAAAHKILGVKIATFLDFPAPRLDTIPGHQLADALLGRYRTPRNASGISATMISALKMTADRIADCGECSRMMFSLSSPG